MGAISEMDCIKSQNLLKIFTIISGVCLAICLSVCIRIIVSHFKNWVMGPIQSRMIFVVSLNIVCAIAFLISMFLYKNQDYIELLIEGWVCLSLLVFYHGLTKLLVALELKNNRNTYQLTLQETRAQTPEIYESFNGGEIAHNFQFKRSAMTIMFYHLKKLKHIKIIGRCREPTDTSTLELALEKVVFVDRAVITFVVLVPLIIIANIVITEVSHKESRALTVILHLVKLIVTVFAMINILQCCMNLENSLPRHHLVGKFLALKLVIILFLLQSAIFRAFSPSYECLSSSEFSVFLNALLLSLENVIFAFLYNKYFYCHDSDMLSDTSKLPLDENSLEKL